jgi:hypothetical protein
MSNDDVRHTEISVSAIPNDQTQSGTLELFLPSNPDQTPYNPGEATPAGSAAGENAFESISEATLVSYAKYAHINRVTPKKISWLINEIRTSQDLKEKVDQIRGEEDPKQRKLLKEALLPYFMFMDCADNQTGIPRC